MDECRSCQKPLTEKDAVCLSCGYDPKTDTINPSFKLQPAGPEKKIKIKRHAPPGSGLDPRVKLFAAVGVAILIFSILYKYNFNVSLVAAKINHLIRLKTTKTSGHETKSASKEEKKEVRLEWSDVEDFQSSKDASQYKGLVVEGIFFDPAAKSFVTVNGQVVSEGESVQGVTVNKIGKNNVELLVDGERKILSVDQSIPFPKK